MQLPGTMVRKAIKAGRADDWSPLMNIDEVNPWMMEKLKKSDYQARQEDDQGHSLVQHVQRTVKREFVRRLHWGGTRRRGSEEHCAIDLAEEHGPSETDLLPVEGQGGVTLSCVCTHCHRHPLEDYIWWSSTGHWGNCVTGVQPAAASTIGGTRTESWSHRRRRCFGLSLHRRLRADISCMLSKWLASLPTGGDNLVDTIFEGLQEQGRLKITDEPRRFTEVDNHEEVKIGDLKNSEAIEVVKSKFNKKICKSEGRPGRNG